MKQLLLQPTASAKVPRPYQQLSLALGILSFCTLLIHDSRRLQVAATKKPAGLSCKLPDFPNPTCQAMNCNIGLDTHHATNLARVLPTSTVIHQSAGSTLKATDGWADMQTYNVNVEALLASCDCKPRGAMFCDCVACSHLVNVTVLAEARIGACFLTCLPTPHLLGVQLAVHLSGLLMTHGSAFAS